MKADLNVKLKFLIFRLPKKLIDSRTIKRKGDCCLLLGSFEKAEQSYRRAADALKSQHDPIWHAGLFRNFIINKEIQ